MIKIVTIVGARPQFIKAATVSRAIAERNTRADRGTPVITEVLIHTGQHYDQNMSKVFFEELKIPVPQYNLGIGSDSHGKQTGKMLAALEEVLVKEKPDFVLVYGDTNSTLAGALAASKLHIPLGHVEAGLRSYNRQMPEEINRVVADHVSNVLFCPTNSAVMNLIREGFTNIANDGKLVDQAFLKNKLSAFSLQLSAFVINVGDVMYDSILFNRNLADQKAELLKNLLSSGLETKIEGYCLATIHRAENTDTKENLAGIMEALEGINRSGRTVVFPVHPRTKKRMEELGVSPIRENRIAMIDPVGYLEMLWLEKHAKAILTDSGGVQKEAFLLGVPCVTLRIESEWVETVDLGWNILTGPNPKKIVDAVAKVERRQGEAAPFRDSHDSGNEGVGNSYENPYGDGKAAEKIVDKIYRIVEEVR